MNRLIILIITLSFSITAVNVSAKIELKKKQPKSSLAYDLNKGSEDSGTIPLKLEFAISGYHFNNADFLNYNYEQFVERQAVDNENTDDRITFLYSNITLEFSKKIKKTEFFIKMYRSGFWGSDNLEGRDDGSNPILYNRLYFNYYISDTTMFSIGRHRFSLGNSNNDFFFQVGSGHRDYFFSDTIDGVTFKQNYKIAGFDSSLTVMGDILGMGARAEDSRIWFGVSKDEEEVDDFNGDVISTRVGVMYDFWFIKAFAFYLRYGASSEGGADISEDGKNSINKADNDFLTMGGTRASYDLEKFGDVDFTFAWSFGRDYQFDDTHEYNGFGTALNYTYTINTVLEKVSFSGGYFHPKFCSMKADSPADLTMWAYKGYFASPYAYFYHFKDYAKDEYEQSYVDKTVSKSFGKLIFKFLAFKQLRVNLSGLLLFANEETTSQEFMGTEIEFDISYMIDNIKLEFKSGLYLPSNYYKDKSETNTYIATGNDPFYGAGLICTYIIDFKK